MSDTVTGSGQAGDEVGTSRHDGARQVAEAAMNAAKSGDTERAEDELRAAMHTDPQAVENMLSEKGRSLPQDRGTATDEEVAAISREIQPRSDAPSRSGITGSGSGADT